MGDGEGARLLLEGAGRMGIALDPGVAARLVEFQEEVARWNRRINLTGLGAEEMAERHVLDSLACAQAVLDLGRPGAGGPLCVVDVGSGAGFPGVVIRLHGGRDRVRVVLVEAAAKRARFLRQVCGRLGLEDVEVWERRAEDAGRLAEGRESFDVAVARAVARLAVLAELCLPLVRLGGLFLAMKGPRAEEEIEEGQAAVRAMGGVVEAVIGYVLPFGGGERKLVAIRKAEPTPERYPRRAGVPERRPVGVGKSARG